MDDLIKRMRFDANDIRNHHSSTIANRINEAADALEAANFRIAELEAKCRLYEASLDKADKEADGLRAARIAYASEFAPDTEGLPDVGSIHANIRALKAQIAAADGWKLAPVDPTMEMVVAGFESWPDPIFSRPEEWAAYEAMSGCQQAAHRASLCYAAMLAAAPAAALAKEQEKS